MRTLALLLMLTTLLLSACSDSNPAAPEGVPHALDGSFLDPANHGPAAKKDLTFCQGCHGQPGGPGSNPRFDIGITDINNTGLVANPGHGCEGCHAPGYAHPENWAGPNDTFHYSAGNIQKACTLCHGVALDGAGGVGVSCLNCHAETRNFSLDCTACHGYPPSGTADVATASGVDHSVYGGAPDFHQDCKFCHGVQESVEPGHFDAATNYKLFDKATDTIGDHWNGKVNLNAAVQPVYDTLSVGCTGCHDSDPVHRMRRSGLPLEVIDYSN